MSNLESVKVFSIQNHKGGVTKSTTSFILSNLFATDSHKNVRIYDYKRIAKKTLLIDLDFQRNSTKAILKDDYDEVAGGVIEAILEGDATKYIVPSKNPNLFVLPSTKKVSKFDQLYYEVLKTKENPHLLLNKAIENAVKTGGFETVILDYSPNLNQITIQGMNIQFAENNVVVPLQMDGNSGDSIGDVMETVDLVHEATNPKLRIRTILPVLIDSRNKEDLAELTELREGLDGLVSETSITNKAMMKSMFRNGFSENYQNERNALEMYYELYKELND